MSSLLIVIESVISHPDRKPKTPLDLWSGAWCGWTDGTTIKHIFEAWAEKLSVPWSWRSLRCEAWWWERLESSLVRFNVSYQEFLMTPLNVSFCFWNNSLNYPIAEFPLPTSCDHLGIMSGCFSRFLCVNAHCPADFHPDQKHANYISWFNEI